MNTSNLTILIDANIIIHLEKAMLLPILVEDENVAIIDLIYFQEYEHKSNESTKLTKNIRRLKLSEVQVSKAIALNKENKRISFFDYCNYVLANDNNYVLLTGDKSLKNKIKQEVTVYGLIWYIKKLFRESKINYQQVEKAVGIWIEDPMVYVPEDLLIELLSELKSEEQLSI